VSECQPIVSAHTFESLQPAKRVKEGRWADKAVQSGSLGKRNIRERPPLSGRCAPFATLCDDLKEQARFRLRAGCPRPQIVWQKQHVRFTDKSANERYGSRQYEVPSWIAVSQLQLRTFIRRVGIKMIASPSQSTAIWFAEFGTFAISCAGDGVSYHEYITELTYLLFLKIAEETGREADLPAAFAGATSFLTMGLIS
jgi:hypothetical protein